jgi:hydrogenase assembly chaperone HypC/HupF
MCLPLVGIVRAVQAEQAEVELLDDGRIVGAGLGLYPETSVGQHVLIDRGFVIELIDAEQAEAVLALYAEMAELAAMGDG